MYKIIGADGRQYGPVNADQLRRWIAEGRANAHTQVFAEGATEWKPLPNLLEFAGDFPPQPPPPIHPLTGSHLRKTNGFALWGFILGILTLVCCCKSLFGALGIAFSCIGLSQINDRPDLYEGRGLAIAGIVLSVVGLVLAILLILLALATGNVHANWHVQHYFN